jgi:hypothetical protein
MCCCSHRNLLAQRAMMTILLLLLLMMMIVTSIKVHSSITQSFDHDVNHPTRGGQHHNES